MSEKALGLLETRGLVAAIEACDAMLKAARVRLLRRQVTSPALVTICVQGETAAVKAALDAGSRAAEKVGLVLSVHLIPRPAEGIVEMSSRLERESWAPAEAAKAPPAPVPQATAELPPLEELAAMPVRRLRALARTLSDFPLGGRGISVARREELLELLGEWRHRAR